jgi:subtilisin family serine protease
MITDIENEQNITVVDMIPDGNIAIARVEPSPLFALASISDAADYIGKLETEQTKQETIDALRADPRIAYAQENYIYELSNLESEFDSLNNEPTVEYISSLLTDAPQVSPLGMNTGIIVGILDTGVAYNHPELIDKMWDGMNCVTDTGGVLGGCIHGYDFGEGDLDPTEGDIARGHGTHVAGIVERAMTSGTSS